MSDKIVLELIMDSLEDFLARLGDAFAKTRSLIGFTENMSYVELLDEQTLVIFGCGGGERPAKASNMDFQRTFLINRAMREGGDSCNLLLTHIPNLKFLKL